jgi:hypothetical protein
VSDVKEIMARAKVFAEENLQTLAAELVEWSETALLRDGMMRELARMLEPVDSMHSLTIAERLVQHAALRRVAADQRGGDEGND